MNTWFTSDLHLGHANIIKFCDRPFKDVEQMNKTLVRNWNERVKAEDTVFHVGDFCFKNSAGGKVGEGQQTAASKWEQQLNGKIIFVQGNHDNNNGCKTPIYNITIKMGGYRIQLIHNPEHIVVSNYDIYFIGHMHNAWVTKTYKVQFGIAECVNVGVDVHKFRPVSFSELMKIYHNNRKE